MQSPVLSSMHAEFNTLSQQFQQQPYPTLQQRRTRLLALKAQVLAEQAALYQAAASDFGKRSDSETRLLEVLPSINGIKDALRRLKSWMKPSRRHVSWLFQPASNQVIYQPLGVVGVIVPWNYPIFLALGPVTSAIAAGNQVMVKLSEFTPAINQVLARILQNALGNHVVVVQGDAEVAAAFSQLPFQHLLFTGSTAVGYKVMQSAAANLTPVTLELGGKSPVLVAPDVELARYADRLIFGKCANGGQTCVAPDYLLLPQAQMASVAETLTKAFHQQYPLGVHSADYTAQIHQRHFQRQINMLIEAEQAGAKIIPLDGRHFSESRDGLLAPQLVIDAPSDCRLWQEEIFGPILPVKGYQDLNQALDEIQQRPRPLAFYLFSEHQSTQERCLTDIHAGGVCINETLVHVGQDDLPFGGVGPSGMGHYHGKEGFLTFSHAKAVHKKGRFSSGLFAQPQLRGRLLDKVLDVLLGYRIKR